MYIYVCIFIFNGLQDNPPNMTLRQIIKKESKPPYSSLQGLDVALHSFLNQTRMPPARLTRPSKLVALRPGAGPT